MGHYAQNTNLKAHILLKFIYCVLKNSLVNLHALVIKKKLLILSTKNKVLNSTFSAYANQLL